jgi:hypothetical protein
MERRHDCDQLGLQDNIEELQYRAFISMGQRPPDRQERDAQRHAFELVAEEGMKRLVRLGIPPNSAFYRQQRAREVFLKQNPPLSAFEDPVAYTLLMYAWFGIKQAAKKRNIFISDDPVVIATMPHEMCSGSIVRFAGHNRPVILVDRGLFTLIHWIGFLQLNLCRPVATRFSIPAYTYDDSIVDYAKHPPTDSHPVVLLGLQLVSLLTEGALQPWQSPADTVDDSYARMLQQTLVTLTTFVVAHEVGHLCLGHTGRGLDTDESATSSTKASLLWQQEFEADAFALRMTADVHADMLEAQHLHPLMISGIQTTIDSLMWPLQVIEMMVSELRHGQPIRSATRTHPSSTRRRIELNRASGRLMRQVELELGGQAAPRWFQIWRKQPRAAQQAIEVLQSNVGVNAVVWSHVANAARQSMRTLRLGADKVSPIWRGLVPLHGSTLECAQDWEEEDRVDG